MQFGRSVQRVEHRKFSGYQKLVKTEWSYKDLHAQHIHMSSIAVRFSRPALGHGFHFALYNIVHVE